MESTKNLRLIGLLLMVVSIGLFVASMALKELALIAVGGGCLAIGATCWEKSKSGN